MYLYRHRRILLREFCRVLDDRVVHFKLVRDSYRFLNGFFAYETNSVQDDLDLITVPVERRYKMAMMLKEARYAILSRHWKTMVCHSAKFEAKFKKEEQSTTHGLKTREFEVTQTHS